VWVGGARIKQAGRDTHEEPIEFALAVDVVSDVGIQKLEE
jgi:hypothetical protein